MDSIEQRARELLGALEDLCDVAEVLRGETAGDEGDRTQKIATARAAIASATAALSQAQPAAQQGEVVKCRGPGHCEACSRAAGCCFKGERCGRSNCQCPPDWESRTRLEPCAARTPPPAQQPSVPKGMALVPVEPPPGLLVSMAIRADHGLGCAGYYDDPVFGAEGVGHMRRLEAAVSRARQMFDEVVGAGFYTPEREAHYAAMLAAAPQPQEGNGNG